MEQILGTVERITFFNPENSFTVVKVQEPRKRELTTVVGKVQELQPGESVSCYGQWKMDANHGLQFVAEKVSTVQPQDVEGIRKYLASGLIKGIGPAFADKIVGHFGLNTLKVIDETPERLSEISGIGEKKLERIKSCWQAQRAVREIMVFLQQFSISPSLAAKIYKHFGDKSLEVVQQNPFILAKEIRGIGFKTADKIAENMGFAKDHPLRIDAAITHFLYEKASDGHVCYPKSDLINEIAELLAAEKELIDLRIRVLCEAKEIYEEQECLFHPTLYWAEKGIATELERIKNGSSPIRSFDTEKALEWVQKELTIELAVQQKEAVLAASKEKALVITGGPGTGKSTITKAILAISKHLTKKILLAAPTGRAAKRMSEITGFEARTLHSLLEWSFATGGFKRGSKLPLECDLMIVDEASMIDTYLMNSLLKALPSSSRLILIGDVNQLPSVGPGNVLREIIEARFLPTFCLTEIFRQAKGSFITVNAHRINEGEFPELGGDDFFFLKAEEPEELAKQILHLVKTRLPRRYKFNPIEDIQVIAPMKRGPVGIERLNHLLQETLNPSKEPLVVAGRRFHLHDKVMQLANDYQKEVYNGDIGRFVKIDLTESEILVLFDDKFVP